MNLNMGYMPLKKDNAMNMRKRIFLYFIILIITGMSITGFFTAQHARNLYKDEVSKRITNAALLFDHELSKRLKNGDSIDYTALSREYASVLSSGEDDASGFHPRITLIDHNGYVLGDSQADYRVMENHLDRKEVRQAIRGLTGEDIRFSSTLGADFLYIAVPSSYPGLIIRTSIRLDQVRRIDMRIFLYSLAGMIAGLVLTALLAYRFASEISKPVNELIIAAKEISGGNYSKRVTVQKQDEIGLLSSTFNEMAEKLDRVVADLTDKNMKFDAVLNSMTDSLIAVDSNMRIILINSIALKRFGTGDENAIGMKLIEGVRNNRLNKIMEQTISGNAPVVREISLGSPEAGIFNVYASPISAAGGENAVAGGIMVIHDITAMKKLEQIRTEFVSNVTHELKTPLTSIRGFVETLREGAINDNKIAPRFLDIIDIEAERLTMLINDILQLSEIENRISDHNIDKHTLTGIVTEVISILQSSADKKGVTIEFESAPKIIVNVNRDRIKQMLINLIDNAIKYNVKNGHVRIKAYKEGGRLVMVIADTGIGIAGEYHSRIFERFYRVDKGRSRSMGGTGLGLSIVKHIVNLYNGDISIESEPDRGTKFIIQLPV